MACKKTFFLILHYPRWNAGGMKYQQLVFEYLKKKYGNMEVYGNSKLETRFLHNKLFRILCGLYHAIRIPKGSVLVMTSAFFLDYFIPLSLNRLWKKHVYFIVVHHLVHLEKRTYLRKVLERYLVRNADIAITVSNTAKQSLDGMKSRLGEIEIVNPGLDVERILEPDEKKFPEVPKLLYVGSIEKRKGIIYLIDSLRFLLGMDFEVNLIGYVKEPEYYETVNEVVNELGIQNKVHFRGKVEPEVLKHFHLNSTVFVFPSLLEGYGMATAEAMAHGLPVVATRISATQELVADGVEGILVEPGNSEELGRALKKILADNNLLKTFSRNALKKAKTFPTWEQSSEKIWRIINEHK